MERLIQRWKQYRYRFVPWIAFNFRDRSFRSVPKGEADKLASDADILHTLTRLFPELHPPLRGLEAATSRENLAAMRGVLGFSVERAPSSIPGGGRGVKVTAGHVPAGAVTSLYPGLVYEQYEPILFQSIGNPFIFRCLDSLLIDGNDKGISKFLYRSCHGRDRVGPYTLCDESWLTDWPLNPLAIGQYVNNHNKGNPANVAYQEFEVPEDFPFHLRQYLPNNFSSSSLDRPLPHRLTRLVVLVATREILSGEELFSSYFTVVH